MNEQSMYNILNELEIPVAYDHFNQDANSKVVPPFILYRNDDSDSFKADDKAYFRNNEYIIDLITDKKDVTLENTFETLLNNHNLPFEKNEDFIESEKIYQIRYFV